MEGIELAVGSFVPAVFTTLSLISVVDMFGITVEACVVASRFVVSIIVMFLFVIVAVAASVVPIVVCIIVIPTLLCIIPVVLVM